MRNLVLTKYIWFGAAAYQLGNTSSRTITEVKQRSARFALGWEPVQWCPSVVTDPLKSARFD